MGQDGPASLSATYPPHALKEPRGVVFKYMDLIIPPAAAGSWRAVLLLCGFRGGAVGQVALGTAAGCRLPRCMHYVALLRNPTKRRPTSVRATRPPLVCPCGLERGDARRVQRNQYWLKGITVGARVYRMVEQYTTIDICQQTAPGRQS